MAFKVAQSLETDNTIALGGMNKKTGKPNPKQIEGYFLGTKQVESKKSKNGLCNLHILQTDSGNIGVWGKTDLDRKLSTITAGYMVRLTCTGMQAIPGKNDMYKYKVEFDEENSIEVAAPSNEEEAASNDSSTDDGEEEELAVDADEPAVDEVPYVAPKAAVRPAQVNNDRANRVKELLTRKNAS